MAFGENVSIKTFKRKEIRKKFKKLIKLQKNAHYKHKKVFFYLFIINFIIISIK